MMIPAEGTPTLKSAKSTRCMVVRVYSVMMFLVLGMCVVYIILMGLLYWTGLLEWIVLRGVYLILNGGLALLTLI